MSEPLSSSLAAAPAGQALTVQLVSAPEHSPEWAGWLADLGFLPGEGVRVLRRGAQGTGNLVVRVGQSTFGAAPCRGRLHRRDAAMSEAIVHVHRGGKLVALVGNPKLRQDGPLHTA